MKLIRDAGLEWGHEQRWHSAIDAKPAITVVVSQEPPEAPLAHLQAQVLTDLYRMSLGKACHDGRDAVSYLGALDARPVFHASTSVAVANFSAAIDSSLTAKPGCSRTALASTECCSSIAAGTMTGGEAANPIQGW